jgi:hypothetical protein
MNRLRLRSVIRWRRDADESEATDGRNVEPRLYRSGSQPKGRSRWFVAGPIALTVVGALLGTQHGTASGATPTIPLGSGSATIHWKPVKASPDGLDQLPQPFAGVADSMAVSGVATEPLNTFPSPTDPGVTVIEVVNWEGILDAKPFDVAVFASYPNQPTSGNPASFYPKITFFGAWGSEFVHGTVPRPSAAELKTGKGPLRFHGKVGKLTVVGKVTQPTGTKREQTGSATFVVTK